MKIKNLKIYNKLLLLLTASTIAVTLNQDTINIQNTSEKANEEVTNNYDIIIVDTKSYKYSPSIQEPYTIQELNGYIITNTDINIYNEPNYTYNTPSIIAKDSKIEVIGITDNNWYIIKYNDNNYFIEANPEYLTYHENTIENNFTINVYTTANVNMRQEPDKTANKITTLEKGTKLEYLDYLENNWYLVNYNNQTGYIYGEYISFNEENEYRNDFEKVIYATTSLNLRQEPTINSQSIYLLDKYETAEILKDVGEWYLVRCSNLIGYINKNYTSELSDTFVVVDISDQILTLYKDNTIILETDVVTGTKGINDTPTGMYSIINKVEDKYLTGATYRTHVNYWMPFYGGYGLHDANWRNQFGGTIYETNGSHGCVNIPSELTDEIYESISIGTKVLVHK